MSNSPKIWLLLGAGISTSAPSNLPLWGEIAQDTMQCLYRTLEHKIIATGGDGYLLAKEALDHIRNEAYPEVVLECLCAAYGRTSIVAKLRSVLDPPECRPNTCHRAIAQLCKQGRVKGILTTNFDTLIEKTFDDEAIANHCITTNRVTHNETIPIVKAHGTIDDSSSLVFTRREYYLGLHQNVRDMLQSNMIGSTLVIAGYSGNDMDIFPFVRSMIRNGIFSRICVIDIVPIQENRRFCEMRNCIEYHNETAEDFLCRLANISPPFSPVNCEKRISSILPNDQKYPAALFWGDCLLRLGLKNDLAFSIFFLTQDIVEEETGDLRQLCISLFAKSYALFNKGDNSWGESEYSSGRTLLHNILEKSNLHKYKNILSEFGRSLTALEIEGNVKRMYGSSGFMSGRLMSKGPDRFDDSLQSIDFLYNVLHWEMRARIRTCFSALAFAARTDCTSQQRYSMLGIVDKLMRGFNKWDTYFTGSSSADELPILPVFYSKYFRVYRSIITKNYERAQQDLDECITLCRKRGFYIGTCHCYFLKKICGIGLLETERKEYESIQNYCGVDEKSMIALLYHPGREPFDLTISTYKPPMDDK